MMTRKRLASDGGFSLLEVLVAIALFGIILASTGWAILSAVNSQAEAEARDKAIQIAQDAMSIALKTDYDKLSFTPAQVDDAVVNGYYASPAGYELPRDLDIPTAGTTEPRIISSTLGNSDLVPYVYPIIDVNDWTNQTVQGRKYTLVTNITEEKNGIDLGGNVIPTGKRIVVMVQWDQSGGKGGNCGPNLTSRCIYQTFLRAPGANEQIPPNVGDNSGTADGCDQPAPFCRVYITEGNVIAKNPGPTGQYPVAVPVQFFVETRADYPVTDISATINYPMVDRGKVCGDRTNAGGSAIEYGFCGNGDKIPAKLVNITAATVDTPEGFRLLSNNPEGQGRLFLATIPAETAASGDTAIRDLDGYIRPGTWPVQFTANNESISVNATWSYSDETPLAASLVGTNVVPNGQVRFVVNGLSPNSQPYGTSLRLFGSEFPPANKAGADHIEVTAQFYDSNGVPYEKILYVQKDGIAQWDVAGLTMYQGYTISASQITDAIVNPFDYGPQNFIVKVTVTRAVDNITTVSALKMPMESSSIPTAPTPSAPLNLQINNRTDVASWDPPAYTGGQPIVSYTVRAYDAATGGTLIGSCSTSGLSCTIPNTEDGKTYYVEVLGRNAWKTGDATVPRVAYTADKSTPPGSPTGLFVNNQSTATWVAPASNGGRPITSYTVKVWTASTGGTLAGTCSTAGALTCTVAGLTDGITYYAEVFATNVSGDGNPSSPRTAFVPDTTTIPDPPRNLTVKMNGIATWQVPVTNGGNVITGYTVKAYAASTGGTALGTCTTTGALTCTLGAPLVDGTTYWAEVVATNVKGDSQPSTPRVSFLLNPNAIGGNNIYVITDGTGQQWRVHEFLTTGNQTFKPNAGFDAQYLVVAGGGGGGNPNDRTGGGGGAGGMLEGTQAVLKNGTYNVTVGAGGTATNNGANSVFGTATAIGGGRGGTNNRAAATGGSGGGGYHNSPQGYTTTAGTAGQGNAGGSGWDSGNVSLGFYGGGGGGAGGRGQNTTIGAQGLGIGGAGKASSITGTSKMYAGGGGGGTQVFAQVAPGGTGGGGNGAHNDNSAPTAGAPNTGGGGGGGSVRIGTGGFDGASGGSGVVVIRYKIS